MLQFPAFNEVDYTDHQTNTKNRVLTVKNATPEQFNNYCRLLQENGFTRKEARGGFAAWQKEAAGIFLNYYDSIRELRIVTEENCRYFAYSDIPANITVTPQITQLHLEDFGMSYTVRLSDGRFIVIDGGNDYTEDGDRLDHDPSPRGSFSLLFQRL